ncbi:MAG: histidine phosphatase family protein [Betaproteobacteria bacterium]|jgi:probable phosphoglycerate mutase|nr:histidine phosphatase family protein [Betaproteobacteria bacterium]
MSAGRRTTLVLVRHGETAWNAEGRVQGQTDVPLNEVGRAQAQALAPVLAAERIDAIYSSDLLRVRETAQPTAGVLGLAVSLDAGLRERHYGMFETLTYVECRERFPVEFERFRQKEPGFDFGSGESLQTFYARALATVAAIAARHAGETVLVFTHGGVLEMLYREATARGLRSARDFAIPNAAINRFEFADGRWQLRAWAECAHLDAALDDLRD